MDKKTEQEMKDYMIKTRIDKVILNLEKENSDKQNRITELGKRINYFVGRIMKLKKEIEGRENQIEEREDQHKWEIGECVKTINLIMAEKKELQEENERLKEYKNEYGFSETLEQARELLKKIEVHPVIQLEIEKVKLKNVIEKALEHLHNKTPPIAYSKPSRDMIAFLSSEFSKYLSEFENILSDKGTT